MHWTPCGFCNRPLRWWALIHCALQTLQAPMRLMFYWQLHRRQEDLQEHFKKLTHSLTWRCSKTMSIASYGWFIIGVVWLLNSSSCTQCPGIYRLCLAIIFTSVARLIATLLIFYHTFQQSEDQGAESAPKPKGAPQTLIDSIPLEVYCGRCGSSEDAEGCAVCLNDFHDDDVVRRLPCGHGFHRQCVDKWLKQNKVCPLCVQDVETLMQAKAKEQAQGSTLSYRQRVRSSVSKTVNLWCGA